MYIHSGGRVSSYANSKMHVVLFGQHCYSCFVIKKRRLDSFPVNTYNDNSSTNTRWFSRTPAHVCTFSDVRQMSLINHDTHYRKGREYGTCPRLERTGQPYIRAEQRPIKIQPVFPVENLGHLIHKCRDRKHAVVMFLLLIKFSFSRCCDDYFRYNRNTINK